MKPYYELSEVKSFVDSYDPDAVVGFSFSMTSGPSRADQQSRTSYVYAWCDPLNHVFYIGKGYGRRAWETVGHGRAVSYAKKHHAGAYTVHLLKDGISDAEAQELEEAAISEFGNALTNWNNVARDLVFPEDYLDAKWASPRRPRAQDLTRTFLGELKGASDTDQQLAVLRKWVTLLRELQVSWNTEDSSDAQLVAHISMYHRLELEENWRAKHSIALLPDVVDRLTRLLWKSQLFAEIVTVIDNFESWYPKYFTTDGVDEFGEPRSSQLTKREQGFIKRREDARRMLSAQQ